MDPNQINRFSGMIAGMMGAFLLIGLVFLAFVVFLVWRIFTKAGLAGPLSLLLLVPGFGGLIVLCILAFSDWRVVPAPFPYTGLQPYPPPPPNYPSPPPTGYAPPPPPPPQF